MSAYVLIVLSCIAAAAYCATHGEGFFGLLFIFLAVMAENPHGESDDT